MKDLHRFPANSDPLPLSRGVHFCVPSPFLVRNSITERNILFTETLLNSQKIRKLVARKNFPEFSLSLQKRAIFLGFPGSSEPCVMQGKLG